MDRPVSAPTLPGQVSVWTFPRPPRLESVDRHVVVVFGGEPIAEARTALLVLETSHPPTWYLPRTAFRAGALRDAAGSSFCEWKGTAAYLDVLGGGGRVALRAAWHYPRPAPAFAALVDHVALYAGPMDACVVDGQRVVPQPGGFYGGWITSDVSGPFKGEPRSSGW
jgi:uncharacterized protein (DUF427 family)